MSTVRSREQLVETVSNPRQLATPVLAVAIAAALLVGGRLTTVPSVPIMALLGAPVIMCMSIAKDSARFALTIAGLLAALLLGNAVAPVEGGHVWYADRTFFGVYRVPTDAATIWSHSRMGQPRTERKWPATRIPSR